MATFYNPVYITATELRANSQNVDLVAETDEVINAMIVKAQFILDGYIGPITPNAEGQPFKFPTTGNEIPLKIKQSTVFIVEAIYSEIKQKRNGVKSEAWDGYSVSYANQIESSNYEYIEKATQELLAEYGLGAGGRQAFSLNY